MQTYKKHLLLAIFLLNIFTAKLLANPFSAIESSVKEVESGVFGVINGLIVIWFIVGVFWWLFSKRGFLMLVLLPLIGWAIINGRDVLFNFAKTFVGG